MNTFKKLSLVAALMASVLAGCGGGTTTASGSSLGGTAAVGAPIASGTITISCAGGNPTTPATTTTDAVGAWTLTLTGQTLPCAVQVSGGTINGVTNTTPYHSIASAVGTVNVTPMTDLIVANATGSTSPSTWFAAVTPTALAAITPAAMTTSLTQIRTALNLPALNNVNPLTTAFTPAAGNPVDDILTALQLAITNTGSSLATIRTAAASPTFTPPVGFSTAMNTQHANTSSGGAAAPVAPTGVTATATSASQINLTWSAVSGALSYNVYAATATGVALTTANKKNTTLINAQTYSGTGLTAATTYYIKVTALNAAGESVGSSEATATTQAAASTVPTITSFTPATGAPSTSVSITGTNLNGVTQVLFTGPSPSTAFTAGALVAVAPTFIATAVPAGLTAGSYTVSVVYAGGEAAATGALVVTAAPVSSVGSGVTFSTAFNGVSSISNATPTTTVSSVMTTQRYAGGFGFSYRLNAGVEEFNLTFLGSAFSSLNNGGFTAAPGSCAVSANQLGAPLCSSFGITFNKSAGTVAFVNTPMGTGLFGNAPTIFTMTGSLTFPPF